MEVLSARNPRVQEVRRLLRRRRSRAESGRFVIEGPRLVLEALTSGVEVESVLVPGDAPRHPPGSAGTDLDRLLEACQDLHIPHAGVVGPVLAAAATTTRPQPALAVARQPRWTIGDLTAPAAAGGARAPLVLALVGVSDPGNAGTLVRVAEAAGATGLVLTGPGAVDPFNPKVVRAAAGSLFRLPVVATPDPPVAVLEALGGAGLARIATVAHGGAPYEELDLRRPVALVLGSEAHGLGGDLAPVTDGRVSVPMAPPVESLNVAVAGAVLAFEAARQRRAGGPG